MTQQVVRKKYIKYLINKAKQDPSFDQQELEELIQDLREGFCYGFAVPDALFSVFDYDVWWEHLQAAVHNWDEKDDSLDEPIDLQSYLPPTHEPDPNEKVVTLRDLFEKSLHYTVSLQLCYEHRTPGFHEEKFDQYNLLKPKKKFSIIINNEPRFIKQWDRIGGHFTWRELAHFLTDNKEVIAGNACLIYSFDHTITLKYKNNRWVLYDSNFNHSSAEKMTKTCRTSWGMALHIFRVLATRSLVVDLASFDDTRESAFIFHDEITAQTAVQMIRDTGLHMIAEHKKSYLEQILKLAQQHDNVKKAFIKALLRRDSPQKTGFERLINHAPLMFKKIVKLAGQDTDYAQALRSFFLKEAKSPVFAWIANSGSMAIPRLLALAAHDELMALKIARDLLMSDEDGVLFLQIILEQNEFLSDFLQLSTKQKTIELAVASAVSRDVGGTTGFNLLLNNAPHLLAKLIKHAHASPALAKQFAQLLMKKTRINRTGLHKLIMHAPELLPQLLKLAAVNKEIRVALAAALVEKSKRQNSAFLIWIKHANGSLPLLFRRAATSQSLALALYISLKQTNRKGRTGFESLLRSHSASLIPLLMLAADNRLIYIALQIVLMASSESKRAELLDALISTGLPAKSSGKHVYRLKKACIKNVDAIPELLDALIALNRGVKKPDKKMSLKNYSLFQSAPVPPSAQKKYPNPVRVTRF